MAATKKTSKKPTRKPLSKKAKADLAAKRKAKLTTTCVRCPGAKSLIVRRKADMNQNENGVWLCTDCYTPPRKAPKSAKPDPDKWYLIEVEPGKEGQVRADIMKQVRIRNLEGQVRRVMSPSCLKEVVGPRSGDVLATGYVEGPAVAATYDRARRDALDAAQTIYIKQNPETELEDIPDFQPPGMKITCFPGTQKGTGKPFVEWKVREFFPDEAVRKVVRGRKYPGYMLINMDWNVETEHLVRKTRNVWGVLLQPVVTGHLIKLSERKSQYAKPGQELGWNWRVCEPDGGKCVAKGWAPNKLAARAAAELAKAKAEEFHPTALASQEAAEALIAQKAVNQILKDKEELNKAVVNLRVGDAVRVKAGVFRGCRGEVVRVVRNPKDTADVKVELKVRVLGQDIPATVQHFECERTTHGDRE